MRHPLAVFGPGRWQPGFCSPHPERGREAADGRDSREQCAHGHPGSQALRGQHPSINRVTGDKNASEQGKGGWRRQQQCDGCKQAGDDAPHVLTRGLPAACRKPQCNPPRKAAMVAA